MENLSIGSAVFEKLLADMDVGLNMVLRQMLDKGAAAGSLAAKISIELKTGRDKMDREFIEPRFKFKTGINIPLKGSLESQAPEGLVLENRGGEFVILENQISMDELIRNAG